MQTPELDRIPDIGESLSRSKMTMDSLPQLGQLNTHESSSAYAQYLAFNLPTSSAVMNTPPALASSLLKDQGHSSLSSNGMPAPSTGGGHTPPAPARIDTPQQLPLNHGFIGGV